MLNCCRKVVFFLLSVVFKCSTPANIHAELVFRLQPYVFISLFTGRLRFFPDMSGKPPESLKDAILICVKGDSKQAIGKF